MTDPGIVSQAPEVARFIAQSASVHSLGRDLTDRARGALLGLAVGNLLGLPVESEWHYDIARRYPGGLTDIDPREAHRPMDDDLAQAVDLAEALVAGGDYAHDFADRLVVWARENGRGIGITTGEVIRELSTGKPLPEPARTVYERRNRIAPNGGVMRLRPGGDCPPPGSGFACFRFSNHLCRHPLCRHLPVVLHPGQCGHRHVAERRDS